MLTAMTWRQFVMWRAYDSLEPFGEERADYRAALIASTIVNASPAIKRRYKLADFMPEFDAAPPERITEDKFQAMKQRARMYAEAK